MLKKYGYMMAVLAICAAEASYRSSAGGSGRIQLVSASTTGSQAQVNAGDIAAETRCQELAFEMTRISGGEGPPVTPLRLMGEPGCLVCTLGGKTNSDPDADVAHINVDGENVVYLGETPSEKALGKAVEVIDNDSLPKALAQARHMTENRVLVFENQTGLQYFIGIEALALNAQWVSLAYDAGKTDLIAVQNEMPALRYIAADACIDFPEAFAPVSGDTLIWFSPRCGASLREEGQQEPRTRPVPVLIPIGD